MPMWCPGEASSPRAGERGLTLVEMIVVLGIVGIMGGVVFPAVSAGLDGIRISSATDSIAALLNGALNRAERRQEAVEIAISMKENALMLYSSDPAFRRRLDLPEGVRIENVLPEAEEREDVRRFLVLPGGTPPRLGVEIANRRGTRRIVRVDPMTGSPRIERPEAR
jgi:prepilin-type N-terminal cleavage/methylation domain-containing protein